MIGDSLALHITGNYNVRVQCFERQDPDTYNCPTTTTTTTQRTNTEVQQHTTTTQRTNTEVQQQTTTSQNTGQDGKGTGSGSNGENAESDSYDRTNLCRYSVSNLFISFNTECFSFSFG